MKTTRARRLGPLFVATFLVLLSLLRPPAAHSAGLVVNTLQDGISQGDGTCSLREAINKANINTSVGDCSAASGADTITFSVSGTIRLTTYLPTVFDIAGLTIDGAGQSITISGDQNNDGTPDHQLFTVSANGSLALKNLTLSKGISSYGGAINNTGGTVNVSNVTFSNNVATSSGGAIANGSNSWLTVDKSTFTGNSASGTGSGGAISSPSGFQIWVTDSTFSSNSAPSGGAISLYGTGPITVRNSTFSGNHATHDGGAIDNSSTSVLTISNDTFSANTADRGGAIFDFGGTVIVASSTFSGNGATTMGGAVGTQSSSFVGFRNTILAASSPGVNCAAVASGSFTNYYNNIDDGASCGFAFNFGSKSNTIPQLLPLANNGGPTQTFAIARNSPALDGVVYNGTNFCPSTDQRGWTRPIGPRCDIGAYEAELASFLPLILK